MDSDITGRGTNEQPFYRIPKLLITEPAYRAVSAEAKLLYGLLQDRLSLSIHSGWQDEQGRTYLYYTVAAIQNDLSCCKEKACKLMRELENAELLDRCQQGRGKPVRIYLKSVEAAATEDAKHPKSGKDDVRSEEQTADGPDRSEKPTTDIQSRSEKPTTDGQSRSEKPTGSSPMKSEKPTARGRKIIHLEVGKTDRIKTDKNNTEFSKINPSSEPAIEDEIREQIEYETLAKRFSVSVLDCMVSLMAGAERSSAPTLRIGREDVPRGKVLRRFRDLDRFHIEYIFDCLEESKPDIRNISGYLLTSLYRAPDTIEGYYAAKVAHDECESGCYARAA